MEFGIQIPLIRELHLELHRAMVERHRFARWIPVVEELMEETYTRSRLHRLYTVAEEVKREDPEVAPYALGRRPVAQIVDDLVLAVNTAEQVLTAVHAYVGRIA